jgi:hypothetical protein
MVWYHHDGDTIRHAAAREKVLPIGVCLRGSDLQHRTKPINANVLRARYRPTKRFRIELAGQNRGDFSEGIVADEVPDAGASIDRRAGFGA